MLNRDGVEMKVIGLFQLDPENNRVYMTGRAGMFNGERWVLCPIQIHMRPGCPKGPSVWKERWWLYPIWRWKVFVPFPQKGDDVGSFGIRQSIVDDDRALNQ